jgi:hypothetical protein
MRIKEFVTVELRSDYGAAEELISAMRSLVECWENVSFEATIDYTEAEDEGEGEE